MDKLPQNGQIGENAQKIVASTPIFVKKLLFFGGFGPWPNVLRAS